MDAVFYLFYIFQEEADQNLPMVLFDLTSVIAMGYNKKQLCFVWL
jgi:hypothetical protein